MNRRAFIKTLTALGLTPVLPLGATSAAANIKVSTDTWHWAKVLARSHNTSSVSFLQRHLKIDAVEASQIQHQLIREGIIAAEKNAFGLHRATKPLWDDYAPKFKERLKEIAEHLMEPDTDIEEQSSDLHRTGNGPDDRQVMAEPS